MADRTLVWYIENIIGDGVESGPVFYADQDYVPVALRVMVKRVPDAGDLTFNIKDDNVSILDQNARLLKGQATEEEAENFPVAPPTIKEGSLLTLDLVSSGGKGITIQLELNRADS